MKKLSLTAALFLSGFNAAQAQKAAQMPVLAEEVSRKSDNEIVIPYKRYVMSNGLNIIIHEDHSDPIAR